MLIQHIKTNAVLTRVHMVGCTTPTVKNLKCSKICASNKPILQKKKPTLYLPSPLLPPLSLLLSSIPFTPLPLSALMQTSRHRLLEAVPPLPETLRRYHHEPLLPRVAIASSEPSRSMVLAVVRGLAGFQVEAR